MYFVSLLSDEIALFSEIYNVYESIFLRLKMINSVSEDFELCPMCKLSPTSFIKIAYLYNENSRFCKSAIIIKVYFLLKKLSKITNTRNLINLNLSFDLS